MTKNCNSCLWALADDINDTPCNNCASDFSHWVQRQQDFATCELIEELKKRSVVKVFCTEPDSDVSVMIKGETPMTFESPCTVLVVID